MSETGVDSAGLEARFETIESSLATAIQDKIAALGTELQTRIEAKLSGDVLATKSGALLASLVIEPEFDSETDLVHVTSRGVPYAAIQEFGGKTAAHEIVAIKSKALAFAADGKTAFAKRVDHPGSTIPPHAFMGGALEEMRDDIFGALKATVVGVTQSQ